MGEKSEIEWCDHTFNPWIGCAKVSDGCKNCYAEEMMDKRFGRVLWGAGGTREQTSHEYWKKPGRWNKCHWKMCNSCGWRGDEKFVTADFSISGTSCPECGQSGVSVTRQRVFCGSLMDVFEDNPELNYARADLFDLMARTTNLDWLILTKRPENFQTHVPRIWYKEEDGAVEFPPNIWVGVSVENQETADRRIPLLTEVNAIVRFLSIEPLLGPVDLFDSTFWPRAISVYEKNMKLPLGARRGFVPNTQEEVSYLPHVDWVIVGGESGRNARPMNPDWVKSIRDQCNAASIPFLFKQWGKWKPMYKVKNDPGTLIDNLYDPVGKKKAGRLLDGVEHNVFPRPRYWR